MVKKVLLCTPSTVVFWIVLVFIFSGNSNVQLNLTLPDSDSALYVSGKVSLTSESSLSSISTTLLCFMLGVATISSGCGKQVSSEKSNVVDMLELFYTKSVVFPW